MSPPRLFDRRLQALRLARMADRLEQADFLRARAAAQAVESLDAILRPFPVAVDLGARSGSLARALAGSAAAGRIATLIQAERLPALAARLSRPAVVLDEAAPALAPASVNLIVSLLALHTVDDLPGALVQIRRALKPDGLFLGSVFGPATLKELRAVLTEAELEVRGGAAPRVSPFIDAQDAAGLLQRAGLALPVADSDTVTVRYADPLALIADLRAMGETSAPASRPPPLTRQVFGRAMALYAQRHSDPDGRIRATFELVHLAGWAPHESQQKPLRPGSARMSLAEALGVREGEAGSSGAGG